MTKLQIIAGALIAVISLFTFVRSTIEYIKQGTQKRIELFFNMKQAFYDNKQFQELSVLLHLDRENPRVRGFDAKVRGDYASFFEELALLQNSGLLKKKVACYFFSYDAILCWESNVFWEDMIKDDIYWGVFRKFVDEIKVVRSSLKVSEGKMRF